MHALHHSLLQVVLLASSFAAVAAFTAYAAPGVTAQDGGTPVAVASARLAPATATVGDRLTLTIAVEHAARITLTPPGFGAGFGGLEVVAVPPPVEDRLPDGRARTTFAYVLTAFRPGTFTVPPLSIAYGRDDGTAASVETEAQVVAVTSVLAAGDTELRPLKPQLGIDAGAPSPALPALFVAAFAAVTAAGYLVQHRAVAQPLPAAAMATAAPPSPHAAALAAFDLLAAEGTAGPSLAAYYARIAAVLRQYLSGRFAFPAYAMTRTELEREMRARGIDRWAARLTANLLSECDAVQFAGLRPGAERSAADLTAAYEIVALTAAGELEDGY